MKTAACYLLCGQELHSGYLLCGQGGGGRCLFFLWGCSKEYFQSFWLRNLHSLQILLSEALVPFCWERLDIILWTLEIALMFSCLFLSKSSLPVHDVWCYRTFHSITKCALATGQLRNPPSCTGLENFWRFPIRVSISPFTPPLWDPCSSPHFEQLCPAPALQRGEQAGLPLAAVEREGHVAPFQPFCVCTAGTGPRKQQRHHSW